MVSFECSGRQCRKQARRLATARLACSHARQILSPQRLGVELVPEAEAEGPHARPLNYVSLVGLDGNQVSLRNELTGERLPVQPTLIVNACGRWIAPVNEGLGLSRRYIG